MDALFSIIEQARTINFSTGIINSAPFLKNNNNIPRFILVTGHRRENFGDGFEGICLALKAIALRKTDIHILYPAHLNPNVQEPVARILSNLKNVHIIHPVDYLTFVKLMDLSYLILTDSGGIQEEAPSLGKPVLVMRDSTERPEAVESGTVKLVGTDQHQIEDEVNLLLDDHSYYDQMSKSHNPYGNGNCSSIINKILLDEFEL